jgi:transposase-like protein
MTTRKKYSKEYKLDAVSLVIDQKYGQSEAARNLSINSNMLGRWIKELDRDDDLALKGNGKLTPDQDKIKKLKAQVKLLEMAAIPHLTCYGMLMVLKFGDVPLTILK